MDQLLFCILFIFQYVGHRVGDYLLQSNTMATQKATSLRARNSHVVIYSICVVLPCVFIIDFYWALALFAATYIEHMIIDSRKPVLWWKNFFEKRIMGDSEFKIKELPFFVLIDIDQSMHLVRIFILSLLIANFY